MREKTPLHLTMENFVLIGSEAYTPMHAQRLFYFFAGDISFSNFVTLFPFAFK